MFWKRFVRGEELRKRRGRVLLKRDSAVYHVVSKTAYHEFRFSESEKRVFRGMLERQAAFCGVEVLAFCILDNHFHLLVRVPYENSPLEDAELIRRYRSLYEGRPIPESALGVDEVISILAEGGSPAKALRKRLQARMGNLPSFVKELKQRFSIWYNKNHDNVGTIWCEPFKSVLIEDLPHVLKLVAAYIDLNPVRAEICQEPEDYPFSTIGEANQGGKFAQKGLMAIYLARSWKSVYKKYSYLLSKDQPLLAEKHFSGNAVEDILGTGNKVPLGLLLRERIPAFSQGGVLGSSEFVQQVETFLAKRFSRMRRFKPKPLYGNDPGGCAFHALHGLPIPMTY